VKENSDHFIIKWMDILTHTQNLGRIWVSTSTSDATFDPLVRAYLRTADVDYLGVKELQKFNKCITSHVTDFKQAILAQVSDKWKPITLADGAF
jgi:hypothetical protein